MTLTANTSTAAIPAQPLPGSTRSVMPETPTRRVGIYVRISRDRAGQRAGVERQRADCEALAARLGWEIVRVYEDNDISASSGRHRPDYEQMLADSAAGVIDAIICLNVDRLTRRLVQFAAFMAHIRQHRVAFATTEGDSTENTNGRLILGIKANLAEAEAERISDRTRREKAERAGQGRVNGSRLAYGHNSDGTVHPEQAAVLREVASRVLAGESLYAVVDDLNRREVPTLRGGTWRRGTLRTMLTSGRLCGWREWTPVESGRKSRGAGDLIAPSPDLEPIITREDTDRLRALMTDPARRTARRVSHLLTGILVCGRCGGGLNSRSDNGQGRRYACIRTPGSSKCGGLSIVAPQVDAMAVAALHEALRGADLTAPTDDEDEVIAEAVRALGEYRERLTSLAADYADGLLSRPEWLAARTRCEARIREAEAVTVRTERRAALATLPQNSELLPSAWEGMTLDQQRAVMKAVIVRIVVRPAVTRGRPYLDPSRLEIEWRV